jgi:hypothetical protein
MDFFQDTSPTYFLYAHKMSNFEMQAINAIHKVYQEKELQNKSQKIQQTKQSQVELGISLSIGKQIKLQINYF